MWECPVRRVTVPKPFAVATTPVTVAHFRNFVEDTGRRTERGAYGYTPDEKLWPYVDQAWDNTNFDQTGDHPVTCVSWFDCDDYISWLRDKTGHAYRFLSEAEWEYCCRAGTKTWFSWGDKITDAVANFDAEVSFAGATGGFRNGTVPVKKFTPNAWGLYQMHGNVCEWCADPWHETYEGAPSDSRVWIGGDSEVRVWRGGSWWDEPVLLRAATRDGDKRNGRYNYTGFRLARDV